MKKLLVAILAILMLLAGAVLVAPGFIDWSRHRAEIARHIGAATGREVRLAGDIHLALLPRPTLSVSEVTLANLPGGSAADMVRLSQLDVRVALAPLLSGEIQVQSVRLVQPEIRLEVLSDGRRNWEFGGAGAEALPDWLLQAVRLDRLQVEGGTLVYQDARTGHVERIDDITAELSAASLDGPFELRGRLRARGLPLSLALSSGRRTETGTLPVRAELRLEEDAGAAARFAGIVTTGPALRVQGDLRAEGADLRAPLEAVRRALGGPTSPLPALLAQPFQFRSTLTGAAAGLDLNNMELALGDTRGTGAISLAAGTPGRADVALAFNRLDLDPWMALARPAAPTVEGGPDRPAGWTLPDELLASVDVSVDALSYRGGVVRQGRLEATLEHGVLTVQRLSALLPGGADLHLAGTLATTDGAPTADVRLEAGADNLRAVLAWLGLEAETVPADRLRKFAVSARFHGWRDNFQLTGVDLTLDTSRLLGGLAYVDRGRPSFGLRLELDRINLDAYLPALAARLGAPAGAGGTGAVGDGLLQVLDRFDANLDLAIGQLTVGDVPVAGLRLDATLAGGGLTLRTAQVAELLGVAADVTGQVAGLAPMRGADLALTLSSDGLGPLFHALGGTPPVPPDRLGPVAVEGRLVGDAGRLAVEAVARALGGEVQAGGTVSALAEAPHVDLKVRATYPQLETLVRLFAPDYRTERPLGGLDLYAEVAGAPTALSLSAIQGQVGPVAVRGETVVDLARDRPVVTADLQTGELVVDRFLPAAPLHLPALPLPIRPAYAAIGERWSAEPIDLSWLNALDGRLTLASAALVYGPHRLDQPALALHLEDGTLTLEQLDGGFLEGRLGLKGRLAGSGAAPSAALEATLVAARIREALTGLGPLDVADGRVDLDLALQTQGRSEQEMVTALTGQGRIRVRDGTVTGLDLPGLAARLARLESPEGLADLFGAALLDGQTRGARLDASFTLAQGVARTGDLILAAEGHRLEAQGTVDLPAWMVDLTARVTLAQPAGVPSFRLVLSGPLDRPEPQVQPDALRDWLARRAAEAVLQRAAREPVVVPVAPPEAVPPEPASAAAPAEPAPADGSVSEVPVMPEAPQAAAPAAGVGPRPAPTTNELVEEILRKLGR